MKNAQNYWDHIDPLSDQGLIRVRKGDLWGCINEAGELVIPCKWEFIGHICQDRIFVKEKGLWRQLRLDLTDPEAPVLFREEETD